MTTHASDFWDRLRRFARSIKLDSLSIGPAQLRYEPPTEPPLAFKLISDRISSLGSRITDVFVISAHNVDEVTLVDRIDADHESEALSQPTRVAGGSGANTAFVLGVLGSRVGVSGIVADDADGRMLVDELAATVADVSLLVKGGELQTGRTTTLVERGGKRLIVVFPGVNNEFARLVPEHRLIETALSSKMVHLSSFVGAPELLLLQRLAAQISSRCVVSLTPGAIYARQGLDRLGPSCGMST